MAKVSTDRVKFNPQLGRMPTLQFCRPAELRIDPSYQRDVNNGPSQALIRKIAQHWNWDLCQPLVVARRTDFIDRLFVIDGQHRLEAARLRGDIEQLPCVIVNYASAADEAASFVNLNQQRRPLTSLQLFRAAVASGDSGATKIIAAIEAAGLTLSAGSNLELAPAGAVTNVGGIRAALVKHGEAVMREALQVASTAFAGEKMTYLGTVFPGIVAFCAAEMQGQDSLEPGRFAEFSAYLGRMGQSHWRSAVLAVKVEDPDLNYAKAAERAVMRAWRERMGMPAVDPAPGPKLEAVDCGGAAPPVLVAVRDVKADAFDQAGKAWCTQCDFRVTRPEATGCKSRHCPLKVAA